MRHILFAVILILPITVPPLGAQPLPSDGAVRVEVRGGFASIAEDDIDATYGALPVGEFGASWPLGMHRLALGIGYLSHTGDPYHDLPGFRDDDAARVRAVPLTLSLRGDLTRSGPLRIIATLGLQAAWIEERLPTGRTASGFETRDGQAYGFLVTIGPEWRLGGGRHVVSLDLGVGGVSGEVQEDDRGHDVDLRGLHLRCGYAIALGIPEVQP